MKDEGKVAVLSLKEIEKVNLVIADIYAISEPEVFFREILVIIRKILSSELASYNEYDAVRRIKKVVNSSMDHDRVFRKHEAAIRKYLPTHPGFTVSSLNQCTILSDIIKQDAFKKTELYNEYYRHLNVESQMFTEFPSPHGMRSLMILSRNARNFTERERFMLGLIKPHIIGAYRNALELHRYREKVALFERGGDFPALRALGLTGREAVILGWAAKGKTNADIAMILGISRRTVEKHFERVFEKLGVETKIAAVSVIVNTSSRLSPFGAEEGAL